MTTESTHAPTPTPEHKHTNTTDGRPAWPGWYAVIFGTVLAVIGVALMRVPPVYVSLLVIGILVLWGLQRLGVRIKNPVLSRVPVWFAWKQAIITAIVGLAAWLFGLLTGTIFIDAWAGLTSVAGGWAVLVAIAVALFAPISTLAGISYRSRLFTVAGLIAFAVVVVFMTQQGINVTETPLEQLKQACEQAPSLFPADCK